MKNYIKLVIAVLFIASSVVEADEIEWHDFEGRLDYALECTESTSIVVLLHGANVEYLTSGIEILKDLHVTDNIIRDWLSHCALVVLPHAMIMSYDGVTQIDSWDFTGEYSDHKNIEDMKELMILGGSFDLPVILVGGSAGALMAYRVASELVNEGIDVIDGLVLVEVMSPYSLSIYADNAVYVNPLGIAYHPVQHPLGGLNAWNIPTIIAYSVDDNYLPEKFKRKFIGELAVKARDLYVVKGGFNHLINEYALGKVTSWILDKL